MTRYNRRGVCLGEERLRAVEPDESPALGAGVDHAQISFEGDEPSLRAAGARGADRRARHFNGRDLQRAAGLRIRERPGALRMGFQLEASVATERRCEDAVKEVVAGECVHDRGL